MCPCVAFEFLLLTSPHACTRLHVCRYAREDQKQHARSVWQSFLRRYRLKWQQVPLLVYDPHGGSNAFTLAP